MQPALNGGHIYTYIDATAKASMCLREREREVLESGSRKQAQIEREDELERMRK